MNILNRAFAYLAYQISKTIFYIKRRKLLSISGVEGGDDLIVQGWPDIILNNGAKLYIGRQVVLNSSARNYHVFMHSAVKIFAEGADARVIIGDCTRMNGACIHARASVKIGANCLIASNCQIMDSSGHALSFDDVDNRIKTRGKSKPVEIADSVWLGVNCIILPGVTIGRGSVIRAGSVVSESIPPFALAGGNPAIVLKQSIRNN